MYGPQCVYVRTRVLSVAKIYDHRRRTIFTSRVDDGGAEIVIQSRSLADCRHEPTSPPPQPYALLAFLALAIQCDEGKLCVVTTHTHSLPATRVPVGRTTLDQLAIRHEQPLRVVS